GSAVRVRHAARTRRNGGRGRAPGTHRDRGGARREDRRAPVDPSGDRAGRPRALRGSPETEEGHRGRRPGRRGLSRVPRTALGHGARPDQTRRGREEMRILPPDPGLLIVSCDGAARGNPGPAGIGVQITDEAGNVVAEIAEWLGEATNNVAEYTAALEGLRKA